MSLFIKCTTCAFKGAYTDNLKDIATCPDCRSMALKGHIGDSEPDWWGENPIVAVCPGCGAQGVPNSVDPSTQDAAYYCYGAEPGCAP